MESLRWPEGGGGEETESPEGNLTFVYFWCLRKGTCLEENGNLICAQGKLKTVLWGSLHSNSTLLRCAGY